MSSVSSIAASGMLYAAARLQTSAAKIADPSSKAALSTEAVNQVEARIGFTANALMLRADSQMTGALLDMLA
jgi:flagellar basal body rod protein FlgC